MRTLMIVCAVALIAGGSAAVAQSNAVPSPNLTAPPATTNGGAIGTAPVGHRQPRAGEVPSEKNPANPQDAINREDAALDRKINGICRGC